MVIFARSSAKQEKFLIQPDWLSLDGFPKSGIDYIDLIKLSLSLSLSLIIALIIPDSSLHDTI